HLNRVSGLKLQNWERARQDHAEALRIWKKLSATNRSREESIIEESMHLGAAQSEVGRMTNDVALIEAAIEMLKQTCKRAWVGHHHIFHASVELLIAYEYLLATPKGTRGIFDDAMALVARLDSWIDDRPVDNARRRDFEHAWISQTKGSILSTWAVSDNHVEIL